jgi:hypothetical protein
LFTCRRRRRNEGLAGALNQPLPDILVPPAGRLHAQVFMDSI